MVPPEITSCTDLGESPLQVTYAYPPPTGAPPQTVAARAPMWAVGALLLMAGTGGSISVASTSAVAKIDSAPTGSTCRIECVSKPLREAEEDRTAGSTKALSVLQHYLSLNLSELATVLQVSRPTIYSWLRDESAPQAQNVARIRQLFRLAKIWPSISGKPLGSRLKMPVADGQSVFDLLSQDRIDLELVRAALVSCAVLERETALPPRRTAAEIAKQFGLQQQPKGSQEESVAQETGL